MTCEYIQEFSPVHLLIHLFIHSTPILVTMLDNLSRKINKSLFSAAQPCLPKNYLVIAKDADSGVFLPIPT